MRIQLKRFGLKQCKGEGNWSEKISKKYSAHNGGEKCLKKIICKVETNDILFR